MAGSPTALSWVRLEPGSSTGTIDSVVGAFHSQADAANQAALFLTAAYRTCRSDYLTNAMQGVLRLNKVYRAGGVIENVFLLTFERQRKKHELLELDLHGYRGRVVVTVSYVDDDSERIKSGVARRLAGQLFHRIVSHM